MVVEVNKRSRNEQENKNGQQLMPHQPELAHSIVYHIFKHTVQNICTREDYSKSREEQGSISRSEFIRIKGL